MLYGGDFDALLIFPFSSPKNVSFIDAAVRIRPTTPPPPPAPCKIPSAHSKLMAAWRRRGSCKTEDHAVNRSLATNTTCNNNNNDNNNFSLFHVYLRESSGKWRCPQSIESCPVETSAIRYLPYILYYRS